MDIIGKICLKKRRNAQHVTELKAGKERKISNEKFSGTRDKVVDKNTSS